MIGQLTRILKKRVGQGLVETALIFPIFLIVVFGVMQLGHIAAMTIVVNHAAFEVARIGAIASEGFTPGQAASCANAQINVRKMNSVADKIFEKWPGKVVSPLKWSVVKTLQDPEAKRNNCDLVVELQYQLPLIFPFINVALAQPPHGGHSEVGMYRLLLGSARMPLEVPIWSN
ncbi:MAG: TadE family protein [Elusimicrobiota bacterium]